MGNLKIKTRNRNPNFTIILPGPCQAKCDFCFWSQEKNSDKFIKGLKKSLKELPDMFNQISISGGEPTLSPVFDKAMKIINKFKKKGKINKVVLTSNGIKLKEKNLTGIDHVNISRHHYDYSICQSIFKTSNIPSNEDLIDINQYINKYGIDVNYNIVMLPHEENNKVYNDKENKNDLRLWANFVKKTGATSLTFRNQYDNYGISHKEQTLLDMDFTPKTISTCPVCRTAEYYYDGVKMKFHSSDYEPTDSSKFDKNEVYEVILQQNGALTRDWEAKKILLKP